MPQGNPDGGAGWIRRQIATARRLCSDGQDWARRRIPPGLRTVLGLLLVVGGVLGFLPILGFWMLPLGVAVIWVDIAQAIEFLRDRMRR